MEFRNLKKQYTVLEKQINEAVHNVMREANFIGGNEIAELERELAEYVGVPYCISCANGTDALELALMAWKIGKGDAVFVPDFTFFSSGEVIADLQATPVFVDVRPDTYNMDADKLEQMIQRVIAEGKLVPRAIIAVDLFGQPAEYNRINHIAEHYGLKILEDGAQGFGGRIEDKRACSFGDISTTSFFPAKPLGCYGDGGAVFLKKQEEYELIKSLCVHGKGKNKYDNVRIGMNSRLDTMQAAILRVKLGAFKQYELEKVNEYASSYSSQLCNWVQTPHVNDTFLSSWAQYVIQLDNREKRDELQKYLKQFQIPSMVYYPKPMHRQEAFKQCDFVYKECDYDITNHICDCVLALPISPYIEENEVDEVSRQVISFLQK